MGGLSAEAQSARCIRQPSFNLEGGAELSCHMEGGSNWQATKSQGVTTVTVSRGEREGRAVAEAGAGAEK